MATEQAFQQGVASAKQIRLPRSPATTIVASGLGLVLLTVAIWAAGGFDAALRAYLYMSGETLFIDSTTKSFGSVRAGDPTSVSFQLTNRGTEPVRIVGCLAYCNCIVPADLPITLNPSESRDFIISIHTFQRGGESGTRPFNQPVNLYTTNPAQAEIPLTVKGVVQYTSVPPHSRS